MYVRENNIHKEKGLEMEMFDIEKIHVFEDNTILVDCTDSEGYTVQKWYDSEDEMCADRTIRLLDFFEAV